MTEVLELGPAVLAALALAAFAGALMQRLAGQGFGMLASPVMAILAPGYLPATILITGLIFGLSGAAFDRGAITRSELPPGFAGRIIGAGVAAVIAAHVADTHYFGPLIAVMVFLGIGLSLAGLRLAIRPGSLFGAGIVSGVMGTLTGVGAPPMALLYQHEPQRRSAAMQNTFYLFGMAVSIPALGLAGLVGWKHLALALVLTPPALAAVALARPLSRRFARAKIRPLALTLAGCAATVLLAKSVWG